MAKKVASSKEQKPKTEKQKSRGVLPMASARAIIPAAPNCICPTCSANDWEDTDPDDTTPPALAYKCKQCGVRHVPIGSAPSVGINHFWVLKLVSANNLDVSGTNYRRVEIEFEDLITGGTDSLVVASQISKTAIGAFGDSIDFNGVSAPNTISFKETGTGNSQVAKFEIEFTSVTGIKIISNLVVGFKNGEVGIILTEPEIVSASGNDAEVSSRTSRAVVNGTNLDPLTAVTGYLYEYKPVAGSMVIPTQPLVQGGTPGTFTYTATSTMQNDNKMTLIAGNTVLLSSQAVVEVIP